MLVIEQNWDELTNAFRIAVELISSFGYSRENITSNNLIIPIAYCIKSIDSPANFVTSSVYAEDGRLIKKWFIASLLNRVFSFMPDGLLKPVRTIIDNNPGKFPYEKIADYFRGTNRDILFTDDSIDNLLWTKYGTGDLLIVLSVLYPWADLKNNFHIDHIYPKSKFTTKKLTKKGIPEDKISYYIENVNYLGNLQLLEATPNEEKNNKDFDVWLKEAFSNPDQLKAYKEKHFIPDVDLSFGNFEEFLGAREEVIAQFPELAKLIQSTATEYKGMLETIIASEDESIKQVYGILDKELDSAAESRKEYSQLASQVLDDLSKGLSDPNLSEEEKSKIRTQEIEVLKMVGEKDTEIREQEKEIVNTADKKDSEKRAFNWKTIGIASMFAVTVVGIGAAALGGNFNVKLPKKS